MPAKFQISPASLPDAQAIAEMSRQLVETGLPWSWTPARVTRHISHADSMVLAARCRAGLAGFAIMHFGDEVAHLNLLAVDPPHQRQGLGRDLMAWLEKSAINAGIFLVCLEVRVRNPEAVAFYQQLGYREAGRLPRYYSGREDAIRMTRDLRHPAARPGARNPGVGSPGANPARDGQTATADWILSRFKR